MNALVWDFFLAHTLLHVWGSDLWVSLLKCGKLLLTLINVLRCARWEILLLRKLCITINLLVSIHLKLLLLIEHTRKPLQGWLKGKSILKIIWLNLLLWWFVWLRWLRFLNVEVVRNSPIGSCFLNIIKVHREGAVLRPLTMYGQTCGCLSRQKTIDLILVSLCIVNTSLVHLLDKLLVVVL